MKTEEQIRNRITDLEKLEDGSSPQEWWKIQRGIDELSWVLDE